MENKNFMEKLKKNLEESKEHISIYVDNPKLAVIFGTGLAYYTLKKLKNYKEIPYSEIPHFSKSTASACDKRMIFSEINGKEAILMAGRYHFYEGYDIQEVVYPIHLLKESGVENLVLTSAVGGVNKNIGIGDLMIVKDHINLTSINPLIGYDDSLGKRFLDCSNLYDENLIKIAEEIAKEKNIKIKKGNMFFLPGPTFETKAEFNALNYLGADTIGWSSIPEAITAHYRGMRVLAINCITDSLNSGKKQTLEEITKVANKASKNLYSIIIDLVSRI